MPNHLCVWRKSLAVEFKDISYGEDAEWASRMRIVVMVVLFKTTGAMKSKEGTF